MYFLEWNNHAYFGNRNENLLNKKMSLNTQDASRGTNYNHIFWRSSMMERFRFNVRRHLKNHGMQNEAHFYRGLSNSNQ